MTLIKSRTFPCTTKMLFFHCNLNHHNLTHRDAVSCSLISGCCCCFFCCSNKIPIASIKTSMRKVRPKGIQSPCQIKTKQTVRSYPRWLHISGCCSRLNNTHNITITITALAASSCSFSARLRPNPGVCALQRLSFTSAL